MDSKQEFDHCSKLIKTEVARFEQERIEDFKDALHAFLDGMITGQKDVSAVTILINTLSADNDT
jgi:sorting nexin-1/2